MKRRNSRSQTSISSRNRLKAALIRQLRSEALERRDLMSIDGFNPYHNYDSPTDTNLDTHVNSMDALVIINALNRFGGSKELSPEGNDLPSDRLLDVNQDGNLNAMDALNVINDLGGEGEGSKLARLSFTKTDMSGNALTGFTLPVDTKFRLVANIQDLRSPDLAPVAEGVFSIGTNIVNSHPNLIRLLVGETQRLTIGSAVNGGSFTLTYNGQTTSAITYSGNSTTLAARITTALSPIIGHSNFRVRAETVDPGDPRQFQIIFLNNLLDQNIAALTGNFSNLTTSNPSLPSGEITDDFYPADPTIPGAVRNSIIWFSDFPNEQSQNLQVPADGTYKLIAAFRDFGDDPLDPSAVVPAFAMTFQTVSDGQVLFEHQYANPIQAPIGLLGDGFEDPLKEEEIEFAPTTIIVQRNLTAEDDDAEVDEDRPTSLNIDVLANDKTIITGTAGVFSIVSKTNPANGTNNIVTVNGKQQIAYKPNANFFGTDTFTYTIQNNNTPKDTAVGTVTVVVKPINDRPVANNDTVNDGVEDTVLTISADTLLANDSPGPGGETDVLSISVVQPVSTTGGTVALNANGNVVYTPALDFNGVFRFRYKITDNGNPSLESTNFGTVTINVAAVNDAPIAVNDTFNGAASAVEDVPRTIAITSILNNDLPGPLTAVDEQRPNQTVVLLPGTVSATSAQGGTVQVVGTQIIYTSAKDFSGTDTFTYNIEDTGSPALSSQALGTVTINVTADNDPPVAEDDSFVIDEFSSNNELDVLDNDSPGSGETGTDSLTIQSFTVPANGTVTKTVVNGREVFLYTPNAEFIGEDTFNYTVVDKGGKTDVATVTLDVVPVVRPRARTDKYTVSEDSTSSNSNNTFNVMANDLANLGGFQTTLLSFDQPSHGNLALNNGGTPTDLTDDTLVYTPAADYNGPDSFTYTINDTKGDGANSTATVSITVTEVNDVPIANDDSGSTKEDVALTISGSTLLQNDNPGATNESSQTLTIVDVTAITAGGTVALENGNVVYRPDAYFNSPFSGPFKFTYRVRDNGTTNGSANPQTSAPATVTITVSEVNNAPVAGNDSATGVEDQVKTIALTDLLANDLPAPVGATDEQSQTLTVTTGTFTTAKGGTVVIDGTKAVYTPAAFFNGSDSFSYEITDNGTTDGAADPKKVTAVVNLTVSEVNNAPTANPDSTIAYKNYTIVYEQSKFLANDLKGPANESGQTLTIIDVKALPGTLGTVKLNPNGTISYLPPLDYTGPDSFEYTIRDNGTTAGAADPLESTSVVTLDVKDFIPSTISGVVYGEETGNTQIDANERFLGGVPIKLVGTALGEPIEEMMYTLADGSYKFEGLPPGNYSVVFLPPANMIDGVDIVGSRGDEDTLDNQFTITVEPPGDVQATGYNFALNGLELKYALQLDSLASSYYSRDASLRTNGMFGMIRTGNNMGWTAAMAGYDNIAFAEMVLSDDGTRLVLSVVNKNEEIFTTVLSRGQFVKVLDAAGNTLVRVLGSYSKFNWTKVNINASAPISAQKYLDSVEMIFAQEDWDGIAGN